MAFLYEVEARGLAAPFFIGLALIALLLASAELPEQQSMALIYPWGIGLLMLAGLLHRIDFARLMGWRSGLLSLFGVVLLANAMLINPAYHPANYYLPLTLLLSFWACLALPRDFEFRLFRLLVLVCLALALWGIFQWWTGEGFLGAATTRGRALFTTPNTYATAINLALTPLLAYYLLGRGGSRNFVLAMLFFLGLLVSHSRGGYLGFAGGMVFFVWLAGWRQIKLNYRRILYVMIGMELLTLFVHNVAPLLNTHTEQDYARILATFIEGDTSYRLVLYKMALGLAYQSWPWGTGFFSFGFLFDQYQVSPFLRMSTNYVHNDYLQIAMETGAAGIATLLAMIGAFLIGINRWRRSDTKRRDIVLMMATVGASSMLVHALVDYPLYIPFLLAVLGGYLATIHRRLILQEPGSCSERDGAWWSRLKQAAVGALMAALILPVAAEGCADYAVLRLRHGLAGDGITAYRMAQVLQPGNPDWYRGEALVWLQLGLEKKHPAYFSEADNLLGKAMRAHPYDVASSVARAVMHRRYHAWMESPAGSRQILAWMEHAHTVKPYWDAVTAEYARCLAFDGQKNKAVQIAQELLRGHPDSVGMKRLLAEVSG